MNSETHSCTHSFASLEIFADPGIDRFIILLIFAIGKYRSCSCGSIVSQFKTDLPSLSNKQFIHITPKDF